MTDPYAIAIPNSPSADEMDRCLEEGNEALRLGVENTPQVLHFYDDCAEPACACDPAILVFCDEHKEEA